VIVLDALENVPARLRSTGRDRATISPAAATARYASFMVISTIASFAIAGDQGPSSAVGCRPNQRVQLPPEALRCGPMLTVSGTGCVRLSFVSPVSGLDGGATVRNRGLRMIAAVAVTCAVGVGWHASSRAARIGQAISAEEAATLRGGTVQCNFASSFTCSAGKNPDGKGKDCSAKNVYQQVSGGTRYQVDTANPAFCGGSGNFCALYIPNNPPTCGK
jgi:hypothetical protein